MVFVQKLLKCQIRQESLYHICQSLAILVTEFALVNPCCFSLNSSDADHWAIWFECNGKEQVVVPNYIQFQFNAHWRLL